MVGTVDLQSTCESTSEDVSGLWTYLQQIVGQPFLFFRQSYGDELTLHLGTLREVASPKLRRRRRGWWSWKSGGSIGSLLGDTHRELRVADPLSRPEMPPPGQLEPAEWERAPPIEPGTLVELARPFRSEASGGFGLLLVFAD